MKGSNALGERGQKKRDVRKRDRATEGEVEGSSDAEDESEEVHAAHRCACGFGCTHVRRVVS